MSCLRRTNLNLLLQAVQTGNGVTVGYGVLREACAQNRYILGPLYADSEAVLVPLIHAYLDGLKPTDIIQVRIPTINVEKFKQALTHCALIEFQGEFTPQYTKNAPDLDPQFVYSITDFSAPL
ncbi:unnamed protein product [Gongylonema pulchrum]|uniref:Acetyltransf_18 domain-containing protein n=1 Tax=Gongylonema pulchrum TaxID=637853 RepID=A0A183DYB6_9BILA|nr:unnamed protein product [Gongylonema pulchrum]